MVNDLFVVICVSSKVTENFPRIDRDCNHMTYEKSLVKELKPTKMSKVKIKKDEQILVEGK